MSKQDNDGLGAETYTPAGPRWHELMDDFFGIRMSQDKADRWLRLLVEPDAVGDSLTERELVEVLRWVRKKREGDQERKRPTLETLIGWVKWYRKETYAERNDGAYAAKTKEGFIGAIKAAMLKAATYPERWDIMCDPEKSGLIFYLPGGRIEHLSTAETEAIDRWASLKWPDWEEEKIKMKQEMMKLRETTFPPTDLKPSQISDREWNRRREEAHRKLHKGGSRCAK